MQSTVPQKCPDCRNGGLLPGEIRYCPNDPQRRMCRAPLESRLAALHAAGHISAPTCSAYSDALLAGVRDGLTKIFDDEAAL